MRCRDHHNWDVMSPLPLSRLWTWRHLDQVESRLAKEGIWTRSRGLWLVESTLGQWMQIHPIDVVRIRKTDRSLMHIRKLYSIQLCGVHRSRHCRRYLWLQPPSLQWLFQWPWGEPEQSEYTTSNGIHEGLSCQTSLRIWSWRQLLDTIRNMIFKQCERGGHGSSVGSDYENVPLINEAHLSTRLGSFPHTKCFLASAFRLEYAT